MLSERETVVYRSQRPKTLYAYSPGIMRLPSGRLIATMDVGGPGMQTMEGVKCFRSGRWWQGKVFCSDDGGVNWRHVHDMPMLHARPFLGQGCIYIIGHAEDLYIIRSDDEGLTWSEPSRLTKGQNWHQAPSNVWYEDGYVHLVMERRVPFDKPGWQVANIAPVMMRAHQGNDLLRRDAWTFASELTFQEAVEAAKLCYMGMPFVQSSSDIGWLEANVVRLMKPNDYLYDPSGRTFHLFMRTHTGLSQYGALLKVCMGEDGSLQTLVETSPTGKAFVFFPLPGAGFSKFHMLYDGQTRTYWLLSNQSVDSMARPQTLPAKVRSGRDRHRLTLHYSYNGFDYLFAGTVCQGGKPGESRSYASMDFDGEDLVILSRSGDSEALDAHQTNLITFHRVPGFRALIKHSVKEETGCV